MENQPTAESTSTLSRNIRIEGEIRGNENLTIEGRVQGSIQLSGDVHISETGVVEADIEAANITIKGKVTGNISARRQLEILSSGTLIGDCSARSIDIKEGAVFEGRSRMTGASASPGN